MTTSRERTSYYNYITQSPSFSWERKKKGRKRRAFFFPFFFFLKDKKDSIPLVAVYGIYDVRAIGSLAFDFL